MDANFELERYAEVQAIRFLLGHLLASRFTPQELDEMLASHRLMLEQFKTASAAGEMRRGVDPIEPLYVPMFEKIISMLSDARDVQEKHPTASGG
jgi:hypothetical protein